MPQVLAPNKSGSRSGLAYSNSSTKLPHRIFQDNRAVIKLLTGRGINAHSGFFGF
jgi:hypothetical protein